MSVGLQAGLPSEPSPLPSLEAINLVE